LYRRLKKTHVGRKDGFVNGDGSPEAGDEIAKSIRFCRNVRLIFTVADPPRKAPMKEIEAAAFAIM